MRTELDLNNLELQAGTRQLLVDYLGASSSVPFTLFITDPECMQVADFIVTTAATEKIDSSILVLPNSFEKIHERLKNLPYGSLVVFLELNESHYHEEIRHFLSCPTSNNLKFYKVFNTSFELLLEAFRYPKEELKKINNQIIAAASSCRKVRVESPLGTELDIELNPIFRWVNSYGHCSSDRPGILPPSEVATFSENVNGSLVVDGALNANFPFPIDPRLEKAPIRLIFKSARVTEIDCENPILSTIISNFLRMENGNRIGEIGFGTNLGLRDFVGFTSHINERFPGLHIGIGSHNQSRTVLGWQSLYHIDFIVRSSIIYFDDHEICRNGCYNAPFLSSFDGCSPTHPSADTY